MSANDTSSQQLARQNNFVPRQRLEGRTTDPEALEHDKGRKLFQEGIVIARTGDFLRGGTLIATAYLIDGRTIEIDGGIPPPEAESLVLDRDLLRRLVAYSITSSANSLENGLTAVLLQVLLGHLFMGHGQGGLYTGSGVKACKTILQVLRDKPALENCPRVFGGYLTRARIHYNLSRLHCDLLGNYKRAAKDTTAAVEADPSFTRARFHRLFVCAGRSLKSKKYLHRELQFLTDEVHVDNRELGEAYAHLTIIALQDTSLGTHDDAKAFFEKCLRARLRRIELYGEEQRPGADVVFKKARELIGRRRYSSNLNWSLAKTNHICAFCEEGSDSSTLQRCSGCRLVYYCSSTECQKRDWKKHKELCKHVQSRSK